MYVCIYLGKPIVSKVSEITYSFGDFLNDWFATYWQKTQDNQDNINTKPNTTTR